MVSFSSLVKDDELTDGKDEDECHDRYEAGGSHRCLRITVTRPTLQLRVRPGADTYRD